MPPRRLHILFIKNNFINFSFFNCCELSFPYYIASYIIIKKQLNFKNNYWRQDISDNPTEISTNIKFILSVYLAGRLGHRPLSWIYLFRILVVFNVCLWDMFISYYFTWRYEQLMLSEVQYSHEINALEKRFESWNNPDQRPQTTRNPLTNLASARDVTKSLPPEVAQFSVSFYSSIAYIGRYCKMI